ncbi:MAG: YihA family ribosome biogenesis GTP-binding protein [Acidimicrobiia bacterium]|nr:YihA family ribosome biogenesis GTP-binding protein [Acidimicrobiia bacterium]
MSPPLRAEFVVSADRVEALQPTAAEVAVVGRSNVGKSSLLNALCGRKRLAHTSGTPGRTRLLNQFALERGGTLVDCPGYGYAKVPESMRRSWQAMIETYLLEREGLTMVVVLVDGAVGPTALDRQLLDWLRANEVPHTVVATKADKVKSSKRTRRRRELAEGCDLEVGDVVWVSATTGEGIDRLRSLLLSWVAAAR